jgi:hypothetical protein
MPLSVRLAIGFLSKTQIWEDRYNHPNNVDSRPEELIHKASRAFKIKTSGRRPSWSGHASYIYMEIACIKKIVQTLAFMVRTREALIWKLRAAGVRSSGRQGNTFRMRLISGKNFCKFWKADCTIVGRLISTVRTTPRFIKPDAHLNLQPINKGP